MVAESLFDFLETNFDGQSGLACLGSAPLLLKSCVEEKESITAALAASGEVGSALVRKKAALATREAELKEVEERKKSVAARLQQFNASAGGTVEQLDKLQQQVEELEKRESNLRVMRTVQELQAEPDPWKRLRQLSDVRAQLAGGDEATLNAVVLIVDQIKPALAEELKAALKASAWPKPQSIPQQLLDEGEARLGEWIAPPSLPSPSPLQRVCRALASLTSLQEVFEGVTAAAEEKEKGAEKEKEKAEEEKEKGGGLSWAVQGLLQALDLRFRFHFRGARETNRVDKPEWYLTYQLDRLKEHLPFMAAVVQPTLKVAAPGLGGRVETAKEFAAGLVQQCAAKVEADATILMADGSLLMKTVEELLRFDTQLRTVLQGYDTPVDTSPSTSLPLSSIALVATNKLLLQRWQQFEVTCASAHVQRLLDSPDALQVRHVVSMKAGDDSLKDDTLLADDNWGTQSAQAVMALLEGVGERYWSLPKLKDKVNFCKLVQEQSMVEPYVDGLRAKRNAWLSDWKILVNLRREEASARRQHRAARLAYGALDAVAGSVAYAAATERPKEKTVSAADVPLHTLCGIAGSARYCCAVLEEQADSIQFLLLQQAMQGEAGSDAERPESLLDDSLATLREERKAALDTLVEVVCTDLGDAMAEYDTQGRTWTQQMRMQQPALLPALSPEIADPAALLSSHLLTVKRSLHPLLAGAVWREIASRVDEILYGVITRGGAKFSLGGGEQLQQDMHALFAAFKPFTAKPGNVLKRAKEAALLLALPLSDLRALVSIIDNPAAANREDALAKAGVHRLSLDQARAVCCQRVDLNLKS